MEREIKNTNISHSTFFRIHSTVLSKRMKNICGGGGSICLFYLTITRKLADQSRNLVNNFFNTWTHRKSWRKREMKTWAFGFIFKDSALQSYQSPNLFNHLFSTSSFIHVPSFRWGFYFYPGGWITLCPFTDMFRTWFFKSRPKWNFDSQTRALKPSTLAAIVLWHYVGLCALIVSRSGGDWKGSTDEKQLR